MIHSLTLDETFSQIVPTLEIAAGIGYTRERYFVAAGWEFNHWFNMIDEFRPVSPISTQARFEIDRGDISLEGAFVCAGVTY